MKYKAFNILLFFCILSNISSGQTDIIIFDWSGSIPPPCNPFYDDKSHCNSIPINGYFEQWKVSHGSPEFTDYPWGQGSYTFVKFRSHYSDFSEKSEGLFISYPFKKDSLYLIEVYYADSGVATSNLHVYAANSLNEIANSNCTEQDIPDIPSKQLIINHFVGNGISIPGIGKVAKMDNWIPNDNYNFLWVFSGQPHYSVNDTASFLISHIMIQIKSSASFCPDNVTITGNYSKSLTQSKTWIKFSGQTTVLNTANVRLDANPANGYVLLMPNAATDFFLSAPTTSGVFIAQTLDGCEPAIPSLTGIHTNSTNGNYFTTGITEDSLASVKQNLVIYPNPATESFTLVSKYNLKNATVQLVDILGRTQLIKIQNINDYSKRVHCANVSKGVYTVIINRNTKREITKVLIQ